MNTVIQRLSRVHNLDIIFILTTVGLVCYAGLNLCDFLVKSIVRFLFMR